ncbi:MAG: leucine-rich repeat protein, partial [Pseudobutyrivibrio sp.]|nr:leucine-rich repeat protein [Pseudobutyrivibrio sp.]
GSKSIKPNKATYKINNKKLATVNKKGLITVKKTGTAKITVTTKDKKKYSCVVTLKIKKKSDKPKVVASSISLNEKSVEIKQGESYQLVATVYPENTTDKTLEWEVNDPSVLSVLTSGVITGLKSGYTSVWVYNKKNGAYASSYCEVTVKGKISKSGTAGSNITYTVSGYEGDATLTLTGSGLMTNFGIGESPWYDYHNDITTVNIGSGITSVGDCAFYYFTNLTSVMIPNTITRIGKYAFSDCEKITAFNIPSSVTTVGEEAFAFCKSLTSITLPASITNLDTFVFTYDSNLSTAVINCNISTLPAATFSNCTNLQKVWIPAVGLIDMYAFDKCSNLTDIYYAGTATEWNNVTIQSDNAPVTSATIHTN